MYISNIDFVNMNKIIKFNHDEIEITASTWLLEVIGNELSENTRKYVNNTSLYKGTFSRILIMMQWSNILQVLTTGGRHECYFDAEDFQKIMACCGNDTHRLSINSLNSHFKWVEAQYTKKFKPHKNAILKLGRLEEKTLINIKKEGA